MADDPQKNDSIVQIQATASLMTFDAGLYCIFLSAPLVSRVSPGYPAIKVSQAPNIPPGVVSVVTLDDDGIISGAGGAALVRVNRGTAQVLVTTYRAPNDPTEVPGLQVARLGGPQLDSQTVKKDGQRPQAPVKNGPPPGQNEAETDVFAHVRSKGDVAVAFGDWIGEVGSKLWIEGFGVSPHDRISVSDLEYQAMLGKGWLSPWVDGGEFCGSRGMALPILGLRVRLKGKAAERYNLMVEASFIDGSKVALADADAVISAESCAALEAFRLELVEKEEGRVNGVRARSIGKARKKSE